VRIRGNKLKQRAEAAGMKPEQLAQAIAEPGFGVDEATSAIKNWMAGRDHPRCKPKTIAKMAEALGVQSKDIVAFTSQVRHHRGSPRKAGLLAALIRGKNLDKALDLLRFTPKKAAVNFRKALNAAWAEAEQAEADVTALYVSESRVDGGPVIKRFQPKDRGRAHAILKPLAHITVSVEERPSKAGVR
jgi:large subunit ribosomal protein L22